MKNEINKGKNMANTNTTATNLSSSAKPLSLPSSQWIFSLLKSAPLLLLTLLILSVSYNLACHYNNNTFITGAGTLIGILGLLLTIKHGLLSSILNIKDAYNRYYGITSGFQMTGNDHEVPEYVNPVIIALREEYLGILLTIFGALLSGFGTLIPLLPSCYIH